MEFPISSIKKTCQLSLTAVINKVIKWDCSMMKYLNWRWWKFHWRLFRQDCFLRARSVKDSYCCQCWRCVYVDFHLFVFVIVLSGHIWTGFLSSSRWTSSQRIFGGITHRNTVLVWISTRGRTRPRIHNISLCILVYINCATVFIQRASCGTAWGSAFARLWV